jgi:hypothetical protein
MSYIEVSASYWPTGDRVPTKKALRQALSQDLASVKFNSVGGLNAAYSGHVGNLADGTLTLMVVGPDPWTKRSWFANIKMRDGRVLMDDKPIKPAQKV